MVAKGNGWNRRGTELLFVCMTGIFLFYWALVQPFNSAPDEAMRYDVCHYIYEHHALPEGGDPEIRNEVWGYSYAFFPILPQMISAFFMMAASVFSKEFLVLVMAARMTSVFCGMGTLWFCLRIGKRVWKEGQYRWLYAVGVVFLPQVLYLFSYMNNDCLALLATAMIVDAWIFGVESGWKWSSCIQLAVGIIFCALSYYNAYGIILASMLLFLGCTVQAFCRGADGGRYVGKAAVLAVIVLAGIGWWFVRSAILYDGDFLGLATSEAYGQLYAAEAQKPSNRLVPSAAGRSMLQMMFQDGWLVSTVGSFVGNFGYMSMHLYTWMYAFYGMILVMGAVGACYHLIKERAVWKGRGLLYLALLTGIVVPVLLSLVHSYYVDYQPQGRYCMPMLIPLMYFEVAGLRALAVRTPIKRWGGWALVLLWIAAALISFFGIFAKNIR